MNCTWLKYSTPARGARLVYCGWSTKRSDQQKVQQQRRGIIHAGSKYYANDYAQGPRAMPTRSCDGNSSGWEQRGGGGRKYERRVMQPPPVGQAAYYAPAPSSRERRHTRGGGGAHQLARPWWSQVPFRGPVVGP